MYSYLRMFSSRILFWVKTSIFLTGTSLILAAKVFAYPAYIPNVNLVKVSPYDTIATGAANWGATTGADSRDFISVGQKQRIRQAGTVERVSLHTVNKTGLTGFYVSIWRKDGDTYDLVGTSENIVASLTAGQTTNVTLSSPIIGVQEGDYVGYRIENAGTTANFYVPGPGNVISYYVNNTTPSSSNYDWEAQSEIDGQYLPIEIYMKAPQFVFIGDSIMAGHPAHYSFLETTATTDIESTISKQFANSGSYTYQNMGIGGQTTSAISARFAADVVALKPRAVVIEGGVNDIATAVTKSTFLSNWESMLDAAVENDIVPIVLKILPWTQGTNTQMQARDDWNAALVSLAQTYTGAIIVDADSTVGQFRADGDEGNLWDILTTYNADDVHFNAAGHNAIAQLLINSLDSQGPIISALSPEDNATGVAIDANLQITFDESTGTTGTGYITIYKSSDDSMVEQINTATGAVTGSGTDTITINPTSDLDTDTDYYIQIDAHSFPDAERSFFTGISDETTWNFSTVDTTDPAISSVAATGHSSGAVITFVTDESGSTLVEYGPTSSYGYTTAEANTSPRVTDHSISVQGLVSCTTYHYRVKSTDAESNTGIGSNSTFTTTGCTGSATVHSQTGSSVDIGTGATIQLGTSTGVTLTVPVGFSTNNATFQLQSLNSSEVLTTTSQPSRYTLAGGHMYELRAISGATVAVTSFNAAITVKITYLDSDISSLDESSLRIYRWNGSNWSELTGCTVSASANTVSCTTTNFSTFGLFGTTSATSSSSETTSTSGGGSGGRRGSMEYMSQLISGAYQAILARYHSIQSAYEDTPRDFSSDDADSIDLSSFSKVFALRGLLAAKIHDANVLFRDVPTTAWFTPYVASLIESEVATGYQDEEGKPIGEFGVANSVTIAEALKMALASAGIPLKNAPPRNTSAAGTWAGAYIAAAEDMNIALIKPEMNVHGPAMRGEVIQIIVQVFDLPTKVNESFSANAFSDLPANHPYRDVILSASMHGLIKGDADENGRSLGTVRPNDEINRAEFAKIIALIIGAF